MIDNPEIGSADEFEPNRIRLGQQIPHFDLHRSVRDFHQTSAHTAGRRVVSFAETGGEDEDAFHSSLGKQDWPRQTQAYSRKHRSLMDISLRQSKLSV